MYKQHSIDPKTIGSLMEMESSDECKIFLMDTGESIVLSESFDDVSEKWRLGLKTGEFVKVQSRQETPKWNHWLRKRQLCEHNKFQVRGNVPKEFRDALDRRAKNLADQVQKWDFNTALGDTIKEKHSNEYMKVVEVTNVVNRKPIPNKNGDIFPSNLVRDISMKNVIFRHDGLNTVEYKTVCEE